MPVEPTKNDKNNSRGSDGDGATNAIDAQASVADEIKALRQNFPNVTITSATNAFITASCERTRHTRVKVTITFPEGYPNRPLIVDVTSDEVVPPGLKKKLERELGKVALDLSGKHEQLCAVFGRLVNFIDTNRFLPCWRELKQCVDLVRGSNEGKVEQTKGAKAESSAEKSQSTISVIESKGKIKLRLQGGKYFYSCSVIVDEGYPSTKRPENYGKACNLTMQSTNFPPKIETMLTSQARELVRRMEDGMTAEDALKMSNPIRLPKNFRADDAKEPPEVRLTQDTLRGLKHDVDTLKTVGDLREINAATTQGNATIKAHASKERKDARRAIHKITDREIGKDTEEEAKEKQWQLEEKARMAGYNITEYDGTNPQPSLLALVNFLLQKIQRLPEERCPVCSDRTLPADPDKLKELFLRSSDAKTDTEKKAIKLAKQKRPVRTYCGCWYHYKCLDKFMTEPPFGAACLTQGCGRRVYHPDWPGDIKELERAWAKKQARKREIEDAAMFLS